MKIFGLLAMGLAVALLIAPATQAASASGSYSAVCKDGTPWSGTSKRGACHGHKGVASWSGAATAAATPMPSAAPAPTVNAAAAGGVSATCKDGTSWSGKSHSGACRGHKGVQSWASAAAPNPMPMTPPAAAPAPTPMTPRPSNTPMNKPVAQANPMPAQPAAGGGAGMVWVNASTKVYHCPSDRWYGKTKQGQYMTEAQAMAQGDHPDHGKACH